MDATIVKKIGKYEVTGILGRGGMGIVYRAEDKRIGRQVAIKTLTEGYAGQPEMLERFYREAQAGILQHPNIVTIYDLGDENGMPMIVMEYVAGEPLDKLIASGRKLQLAETLSIIEQVCAALDYAHRQGVVHRDIKPANVIIQPDGHAKIVDFGIARLHNSNRDTGLTVAGSVIGTVHYVAPERLKGEPFDGRSDIFSAGVLLYLLLAGQLPFSGETLSVMHKLVYEPFPPLKNFLSSYPEELDAILDRAMAKDPNQRYATADEFANDLGRLRQGLEQVRVSELFSDAERLTTDQQFGKAREVLLQLTRIDAQHTGAKQLLGIVQRHLSQMQRAEQVKQFIAESDQALASGRLPEAIATLEQAAKLDPSSTTVQFRLDVARDKKRRQEEIRGLLAEAEASRGRGDLTGALRALDRALPLDPDNTALRSAHAIIAKEARLAEQRKQVREMLDQARQEVSANHFTRAIEILREAVQIDPSQEEVEPLLQAALAGQFERRRTDETAAKVQELESVIARVAQLRAGGSVTEAIRFLQGQPVTVTRDPRIAQLQYELQSDLDIQQATLQAVKTADQFLARRDYEAGWDTWQAVQRAHGDTDAIRRGMAEYQQKCVAAADEAAGEVMRQARTAIRNHDAENAHRMLQAATGTIRFAGAQQQEEWRRLAAEAKEAAAQAKAVTEAGASFKAASVAPAPPKPVVPTQPPAEKPAVTGREKTKPAPIRAEPAPRIEVVVKKGTPKVALFGGIAAVVLVAAGGIWWFTSGRPSTPAANNAPVATSSSGSAAATKAAPAPVNPVTNLSSARESARPNNPPPPTAAPKPQPGAPAAPPPAPAGPTGDFSASNESIQSGDSVTLQWDISNAKSVSIKGRSVGPRGKQLVSPKETTTYTLEARGKGGDNLTKSVTVNVVQLATPPAANLSAIPESASGANQSAIAKALANVAPAPVVTKAAPPPPPPAPVVAKAAPTPPPHAPVSITAAEERYRIEQRDSEHRRLNTTRSTIRSVDVVLEKCTAPVIVGTKATAKCTQTLKVDTTDGLHDHDSKKITLTLTQNNGDWSVTGSNAN